MRKIILSLISLSMLIGSVSADPTILKYSLTSQCVENISVQESNNPDTWLIDIELTPRGGADFEKFTKDNIGKKMTFSDGSGDVKGFNEATIQSAIGRSFMITGNSDEIPVQDVIIRIMSINGMCGVPTKPAL